MKTPSFLLRLVSIMAVTGLGLIVSCAEDEPEFSREAVYAVEESNIDAYYADADDMAGVAMSESEEAEGGKISEGAHQLQLTDDRFCDVSVELDPGLPQLPSLPIGDITLNFGNACEDSYGNIRRGKIKVHFEGRRFRAGSFISISFEEYEINGIKLTGKRTLTNLQSSTLDMPTFQVELENGYIEWDGKVATREHCFVGTWDRGTILAPGDDVLKIDQCADANEAAEGINRNGVHYRMFIEEELVYRRGCPMAVAGVKKFIEIDTGKEIIIDYGSGTCDRLIAITVNGNIHTVNSRR